MYVLKSINFDYNFASRYNFLKTVRDTSGVTQKRNRKHFRSLNRLSVFILGYKDIIYDDDLVQYDVLSSEKLTSFW